MRISLAGLDAGVRLDAAAIDAHLAGAQQLLQMAEAQPRKMRLEPAIEPHARFAVLDLDLLYACHRSTNRSKPGEIASAEASCEPQSQKQREDRAPTLATT